MNLQKETKTKKFENIFQQSIVNVMFTYNWCNERVKQAVLPYDITAQQFNVLRILRGQYPNASTINLIKERMLDKMSDASRIVDRLKQKELVIKETNGADRRAVDIMISDKGLALLKKMDKSISLAAIVEPNLTSDEAEQLNVLLDKLRGGEEPTL
ncbi:MarR family transcriptional regulator [Pedobacter sp. MC2016-14]|uniref:MarR family winged helix-turn-helix transcriptional regulator n=1 Tax=Pedobacter sp. MC2016-14 TaxID=2897327 RepID=UPI001E43E3F5|nr:MarR family transcriptional regulator [Pedobacter sp. MC2016-14]MCD0489325.1 MarR family transcriptional regulator [Pedobacter sp. MC2016-14]